MDEKTKYKRMKLNKERNINSQKLAVNKKGKWTDKDIQLFLQITPHKTDAEIAKILGRSIYSIQGMRRKTNLLDRSGFDFSDYSGMLTFSEKTLIRIIENFRSKKE